MMGNKASGGIFSPAVVVVRGVMGEKEFNKLRGKAISLHSQGARLLHHAFQKLKPELLLHCPAHCVPLCLPLQ
jgi:hypothetical protein